MNSLTILLYGTLHGHGEQLVHVVALMLIAFVDQCTRQGKHSTQHCVLDSRIDAYTYCDMYIRTYIRIH